MTPPSIWRSYILHRVKYIAPLFVGQEGRIIPWLYLGNFLLITRPFVIAGGITCSTSARMGAKGELRGGARQTISLPVYIEYAIV